MKSFTLIKFRPVLGHQFFCMIYNSKLKNCTILLSYWFWGLSNLTNSWLWTSMPKSRFIQRLRNKINRGKEAEVPQISLKHLHPSFLPRNRRQQVPAQKALKDVKPEGVLQTVKENGQRKNPNEKKAQKKKTLNFTERPRKIQILQRQRRRRQKQNNGKVTPAEEKLLKTKFTSKGPALFGSVQNLKEESNISRNKVNHFLHTEPAYKKISKCSSQNTTPQCDSLWHRRNMVNWPNVCW